MLLQGSPYRVCHDAAGIAATMISDKAYTVKGIVQSLHHPIFLIGTIAYHHTGTRVQSWCAQIIHIAMTVIHHDFLSSCRKQLINQQVYLRNHIRAVFLILCAILRSYCKAPFPQIPSISAEIYSFFMAASCLFICVILRCISSGFFHRILLFILFPFYPEWCLPYSPAAYPWAAYSKSSHPQAPHTARCSYFSDPTESIPAAPCLYADGFCQIIRRMKLIPIAILYKKLLLFRLLFP